MGTRQYIIQLRQAVETYYPLDDNGNADDDHPYEINDCIEPEYVVREKTADNCYADLADYATYDEALKHLKELKGEQ